MASPLMFRQPPTRVSISPNRPSARPPFRHQATTDIPSASTSQSSSSSQEKQPFAADREPDDSFPFDEKQPQPIASASTSTTPQRHQRSSPRTHRGHVRTSSREDTHWNSESRSRHFEPFTDGSPRPLRVNTVRPPQMHRYHSHPPTPHRHPSPDMVSCCGTTMTARTKAWIPLGAWIATSLGFLVAIGWYKEEVFMGLEQLSDWIRNEGYTGQAILFALIFITTFPPMPLYSTLIVLSGYCLGAVQGAILSYFAALSGAIVVFILSRTYLRQSLSQILSSAPPALKRAIRAVEVQPKLLFLIRLSPYPYNLMNALLATSRISFTTYTTCTALSLFKVIVHTAIGSSIHSFGGGDYHTHSHSSSDTSDSGNDEGAGEGDWWSKVWTVFGVVLCIVVLAYLSWVARRAVDDLEDGEERDCEEGVAFLGEEREGRGMSVDVVGGMGESPFRVPLQLSRSTSPYPSDRI